MPRSAGTPLLPDSTCVLAIACPVLPGGIVVDSCHRDTSQVKRQLVSVRLLAFWKRQVYVSGFGGDHRVKRTAAATGVSAHPRGLSPHPNPGDNSRHPLTWKYIYGDKSKGHRWFERSSGSTEWGARTGVRGLPAVGVPGSGPGSAGIPASAVVSGIADGGRVRARSTQDLLQYGGRRVRAHRKSGTAALDSAAHGREADGGRSATSAGFADARRSV